jgi:hypothetical protein
MCRILGLTLVVAYAASSGGGQRAAGSPVSEREAALLLRKADFASQAPASFRAHMRFTTGDRASELAVYRSTERRAAVRFLDPKEHGKWLVYREGATWFISPGAKQPLKLPAAYRLRGAVSIEDLLGTPYSQDYALARASESSEGMRASVSLELQAKLEHPAYPQMLLVVDRESGQPLRAEYRLTGGRVAERAVFESFEPGPPPRPSRIRLESDLHPGRITSIEILDVAAQPVPDALFDLADAAARRALE